MHVIIILLEADIYYSSRSASMHSRVKEQTLHVSKVVISDTLELFRVPDAGKRGNSTTERLLWHATW